MIVIAWLLSRQVHGGIRHLEKTELALHQAVNVHGGIRHLEITTALHRTCTQVHGGIRHLEINAFSNVFA